MKLRYSIGSELGGLGAAVTHHIAVAGNFLLHNLPSLRDMAKKYKQIADSHECKDSPMRQSFKSLSLVTVTLLLSLASPLQAARATSKLSSILAQVPTPQERKAAPNIEGTWTITEGKTLDGRSYTGTVAIQSIGQIYELSWQTLAGKQSGIGFFEDGHLFVGWGTDEAAGYGVVLYKIGKDGTLEGKWTSSQQGGEIGTEIATRGKPNQIEGDYQVSGTNPNETGRYKGTLNIRKTGDTYQVTWAVGTSYRGVGIRSGDWLVVGWGQSDQLGVADYAISGEKASGRSARFNQSSLDIENLVRTQASANLLPACTPAQTSTTQSRKAEADCFLEQGIKLIDSKRFQAALQSLQQAWTIYKELKDRQGEGQVLKRLGDAYYAQKDYKKAIEFQQQALVVAREIHDRELEGRALNNLGLAYKELGDSNKAIEYYQQALAIAQEIQNRQLEQIALNNLGFIYTALKNPAKAVEYYQQILAIAREAQNHDLEWSALTNIVIAYDSLKDNQKIIEFAQQALTLALKTQNREWEKLALNTLIGAYSSLGDLHKVVEYRQQSLAIARETKDRKSEGKVLIDIGLAYYALKNYQQAIASYQQSLAIAQEISDRATEGWSLNNLGWVYQQQGDYNKAIDYYQRSLAVARAIPDTQMQVKVLINLGDAYSASENYSKAIEYRQQLLAIAQELKDGSTEALALGYLGDAYASLHDPQKAMVYYQQTLALARETKNFKVEAAALDALSSTYSSLGDAQKSLEFAQASLKVSKELKNSSLEGRALVFIGDAYNSLGNYQKAIDFSHQCLTIAKANKNRDLEGLAMAVMGNAYNSLWEYRKAVEYAQKALKIGREVKNKKLEAYTLVILGRAYNSLASSQEDYQKAIDFTQQGLSLAQELKDHVQESAALAILGSAYASLEEYQKAFEFTQQALSIARETENPIAQVYPLANLSSAYLSLGDYQKALEVSQQGLAIAQQFQNPRLEWLFTFISSAAYWGQGNLEKSLELSDQSLSFLEKLESSKIEEKNLKSVVFLIISINQAELKHYEKAINLSEESLAITREVKNRDLEETALYVSGEIYSKAGRKEQAITAYREAIALSKVTGSTSSDYSAQAGLASIYQDLKMPITAITYYKQAISGIEETRGKIKGLPKELQESFLQAVQGLGGVKTADTYRKLADLLLSQGRILEAQQVLELLKIQELRDYTKNTRAGGEKSEVVLNQTEEKIKQENGTLIAFGQKIYECQQTRCNQLSQLLDQREALTEQFNQKVQTIEKQVRDRKSQDDAFLDPKKLGLKAKEIVEAQPGTVLIYPLVLDNKIWLLWASKGGIVKSVEVPQVGQKQLAETVLKFRQLLQTPSSNITELQATGKQLYDWLIKPIEPELKANKIQNLVFSLDRAARYIPMSALFDGEKYLVENYAISTVLSADLTNTSDRIPPGTQNTSVLAVGLSNPVPGFNPLPNVPAELDAIVRKQPNDTKGIYPGLEFLNQDFNWRSLRDNLLGHKLLHIATHGEFVPGSPDASYLLLGTGEKLAIPKIATLQDLGNVSLVVLSACETALAGTGQDGTEINGISYYFLNSGAKAVMASLWSVDDDSTRLLMQNFYSNLAKGTATAPITKAEALRQAQLNLLRGNPSTTDTSEQRSSLGATPRIDLQTTSSNSSTSGFSHPYYWAPFILIGNGL